MNNYGWELAKLIFYMPDRLRNSNLVDIISNLRGWDPLEKDEEMTIHHEDREYIIKRTK